MPIEQLQKLTHYKDVLHRMIPYLSAPKGSLPKEFKQDKLEAFEKQIVGIMETFKRRKLPQQQMMPQQAPQTMPPTQNGNKVQSLQQQQQIMSHMQQQEKHAQQLQQLGVPSSGTTSQSSSITSLQANALPNLQHSMMSMLQQSGMGTVQGNPVNSLQVSGLGSLQQTGINSLSQTAPNTLQQQVLKQQQEQQQQQLLQVQQNQPQLVFKDQDQMKQLQHQQHRQLQLQQQQHLLQQQQHLQQQKQQQTGQIPAQIHTQQVQQPLQQQISDGNIDLKMDMKMKQATVKQALLQQQQFKNRHLFPQQIQQQQQQQLKVGSPQNVSSPQILQAPSPQLSQQMSPQPDQQSFTSPALQIPKAGTPMQAATPPFMSPSPSMLPVTSPPIEDVDAKVTTAAMSLIANSQNIQTFQSATTTPNNAAIGTPGLSVSPLLDFSPSPTLGMAAQDGTQLHTLGTSLAEKSASNEPPLDRILKMIDTMSTKALSSSVREINSVISLSDKLAASAPGNGCRAAVGEDLAAVTKCRLQARSLMSQDGSYPSKRLKRSLDSIALSVISSDGSVVNSLYAADDLSSTDVESTVTSKVRRFGVEVSPSLEEEIREINDHLIDTVVDISEDATEDAAADGREGVVVTLSYHGVSINPSIAFRSQAFHMAVLSPVRLLIPPGYPDCLPVVLRLHLAPEYNHPVSSAARDKFARAIRCLPQPLMLGAMARAWDECARNAIAEAAASQGGGCFSSSIGVWESCSA
ncbi:hypothetical protein O6H91_01G132400 [Diphasiastrum complanatum]|nr:hypothetical protein O6H91_01G132400 [Diphasiastrum complanatum]